MASALGSTQPDFTRHVRGTPKSRSSSQGASDLRIFLLRLSPPLLNNYVAATVEGVARQKRLPSPSWVRQIKPLDQPHFAWELQSLRPHLMRITPLTFKRRNVFVDAAGIETSGSARSPVKVEAPGPHLPTDFELLNAELVRLLRRVLERRCDVNTNVLTFGIMK